MKTKKKKVSSFLYPENELFVKGECSEPVSKQQIYKHLHTIFYVPQPNTKRNRLMAILSAVFMFIIVLFPILITFRIIIGLGMLPVKTIQGTVLALFSLIFFYIIVRISKHIYFLATIDSNFIKDTYTKLIQDGSLVRAKTYDTRHYPKITYVYYSIDSQPNPIYGTYYSERETIIHDEITVLFLNDTIHVPL